MLATILFYLVGFAAYGFLFQGVWLNAAGMTLEQSETMARLQGAMMFVWGLLITLAQALGLLWVINLARAKRLPKCLSIAFWLFLMISAPIMTYACLYQGYSLQGILVDFGHILIGYLAMAAIYAMFRGKDKVEIT